MLVDSLRFMHGATATGNSYTSATGDFSSLVWPDHEKWNMTKGPPRR